MSEVIGIIELSTPAEGRSAAELTITSDTCPSSGVVLLVVSSGVTVGVGVHSAGELIVMSKLIVGVGSE